MGKKRFPEVISYLRTGLIFLWMKSSVKPLALERSSKKTLASGQRRSSRDIKIMIREFDR